MTGHEIGVVRVVAVAGHATVYTLTVSGDHTFFVGAAAVLVHNTDPAAGSSCGANGANSTPNDRSAIDFMGRPTKSRANYRVIVPAEQDAKGVWRRTVAGINSQGNLEEVQEVFDTSKGQWVERGTTRGLRGGDFEGIARSYVEQDLGSNERYIPKGARQGGFDGVVVRFDENGEALVILQEYKDESGYLQIDIVTAITENIATNLDELEGRINASPAAFGMTRSQANAAIRAIKQRRLDVQFVIGPKTYLGPSGRKNSLLKTIQTAIRDKLGVTVPLEEPTLKVSQEFVTQQEDLAAAAQLDDVAGEGAP